MRNIDQLSTSRFGETGYVQVKLAAEANIKNTIALQELERIKRIHEDDQIIDHNKIQRLHYLLDNIKQQITVEDGQIRKAEQTINQNISTASHGAESQQDKMTAESHSIKQRFKFAEPKAPTKKCKQKT